MGCGASAARPAYKKNPSTPNTQRAKVQITPDSTVLTLMASLQGHVPDQHTDGVVETKTTHTIEIRDSVFPETMPERIECDDIVEFNVDGREAQDIFQVYRDGDDYYPVTNGYQLLHINSQTPENERRIILSIALNQPEIDLYFCIIPSSERETTLKTRKCPKVKCEKNLLKVQKCQIKISLTDERESQKVNIHKGDTVEINWTTKNGSAYRIEEKKYCPVSGGLYTVEQKSDNTSYKATAKGKFSRTFNDFGMSFIFRFNNANQVHDITVCIINESYKVKHIEINDNNIQPNLIWIEQSDWIIFDWNTKRKQTVIEIEPFILDENKQQSIELKTDGKHFFWPHEPSRRGFMYHQFNETGIYCFKNGTNQIGTIIVEPHKTIYHIPVFGDQLIHKMITKDLVQFDWKMTDSNDDPVFITLDLSSSVVPDAVGGLPGIFDCAIHKCSKVEPFFRHHFHTCEAFLLTIPQHGLYNFASTDNRDNNLISVIIENGIDSHRVVYHEDNKFEPPTLIVNRNDHVWFDSSTTTIASIYETDEYGEKLDSKNLLFRPQKNSINYFMKDFPQEGIYYFTTDINTNDNKTRTRGKTKKSRNQPLAVIVLPDIRFHYRTIRKNDFDHHPIVTNINDFVVWQFEHVVAHNVVQIDLHATIQDIIASHDRAAAGRNRQCLAVECIMPGTFFFSNPEFERAAGSEQDRLISTIVIDPPFAQNCFIVADLQFVPAVLHIAQNETVSWVLSSNEQRHQISVQPRDAEEEYDGFNFIDGNLAPHLHDVHHLHTFTQPGEYIIQSDRFKAAAIVFVYTEDTIRTQKRRVQEPQILGDMDIVSPYSAQVQLSYPSRHVKVLYTLDGSPPTRHFDNVQEYDVDTGVHFTDSGLHLIRAYSIQDEKISSSVVTSSVTYVLESKDREDLKRRQMLWNRAKLSLSASLQQPNKIYGTIAVEPAAARDLIDYYELYINGVGLKKPMKAADGQFLAQGFAGGESYEIYVVGYPREDITNVEPIPSDKRSFDIRREVPGGGPLISISLSNDQASLYLMWAHLGNHVSEYIIYVDNIETKIMKEEAFSDFIGIQFHGAQQRRKYVLHVEAKLKDTNEIRKSNVVPVSLPLNMPLKDPVSDGFFPYITTDDEGAPPDTRLEVVRLDALPTERPQITRKTEILPITTGLRNAIPTISYKRSANGITLYWNIKTEAIADSVENFRIIVDEQPYGKLIAPRNETKYHLNLLPGKHECYLEVLPKDENEEIYKSNVLKIEVPPTTATATTTAAAAAAGIKSEPKQYKEPIDKPVHQIIEQKDVPIPKLNIQTINSSSIRATWYLDRPMPTDVFVALYEVHVRGKEFYEQMTSVEQIYQESYIEHIWHTTSSPLEITGISDRNEYTIYIRALFHVQGTSDIEYARTTSNEVTTARVDPLIDLLPRPLLTVTRVGLQMANLSWKLDDSVDRTLVKGYRIILNSKPTEILPPTQHEYELKNLKPGTTNEIQVSVTSHPDFVDEKVSEPIRIVCPQRPPAPVIQAIRADKPYSVAIKWHIDTNNQDELSSFKVYLDSKLHGEVETNGRQSFKYTLNKLQPEQTYSIYVKAFIEQKKLHGYVYQCDIESKASNELLLKCAVPPKGTIPRIERMHLNGVDLVWDPSEEYGDVKITGYQVLRNGRAVGKVLPVDKRRASINDLAVGNRYSFQIVPITDQPGGTLFRTGEEYDPERHEHYIPGPKLDFEYTDLMPVLTKFWIENIAGHSALACWSSTDETSSKSVHPDGYKLYIWNNKDLTRDKPRIEQIPKDKTSAQLKDLEADTTYEVQLEAYKKRRHPTTNDTYFVASKSEIITFDTGSPPDAPMNLYLIACTNTDARIGFDPFVEHKAEIETIHVQCEPVSTDTNAREISMDVTPDATEFVLTNLTEHTEYNVTIYGVTGEYLNENRLRDVTQLPKKLKPSEWLPNKSFQFQTSGCESTEHINIRQATSQSIQLDWQLPKVYGSTLFIGQILRWKLEPGGEEQTRDIGRNATNAIIPGPLPSGPYKIHLDSIFSIKINLEANDDDTSRKEIRYTASESINVRFHAPATCERPEIYLTGYTTNTIDLSWTKPNLFSVIDHPEKNNEQLIIHRRLIGYRIDIGGRQKTTLDEDQYRCTLTDCQQGEKYEIELVAKSVVQNEYINESMPNDKENNGEGDETKSKKLRIRTLRNQDLLRSFQARFEYNHNDSNEDRIDPQSLGKVHINWKVSDTKNISHFVIQWRSSKDLQIQHKTMASNDTSMTIESCDEKHHYVIEIIIVANNGERYEHEQLTLPIPGEPDAPKLWLVRTTDTSFIVEWSEPRSYGIPIIGYELYIEGKKRGDMIEANLRRAEIPSRINRTYQVNVRARTNNVQRPRSAMSQTLSVITTPSTNLIPTMYYSNDDGSSAGFDRNVARIIPLHIEPINEEKLNLDWSSFLPTSAIRAYYVHYTCLNNGEVQTMKVSKRFRNAVLRGLRPGFTYGILVLAIDRNGGILYTSDKSTVQMNAPPNAPIVLISERTHSHVKLEWRPAASYGGLTVVGYKVYVNNRLAAILSHDQLTYTLTNGVPCDIYTVHVQALSNEKNIFSPMSRGVQFAWPGIRPGAFKRIDDGQTGAIVVAWEHPQLEDEMDKLIGYKLYLENVATHAERLHGEYDAATQQATIYELPSGKYRISLEVQSENFCTRARSITVMSGRFNHLLHRPTSTDSAKCFQKKQKRFRSPITNHTMPALRHSQYS